MFSTRPRFSIAALMGFVFVFGVGMAAFRYPTKLWAAFLLSIAMGALVFGLLGAVFHRGLPQKFWAGFAIVGWLYWLMTFSPWFADDFEPYLLTTACLDLIYPYVAAPEQTAMQSQNAGIYGLAGGFGGGAAAAPAAGIWQHWTGLDGAAQGFSSINNFGVNRSLPFQMIGQSLFVLIFAYLGGVTARRFARRGAAAGRSEV